MRRRWKILLAALAVSLAIAGGLLLTLRSDWLREKIRAAVVEQVERASGGKVTINSFDFDLSGMRARTGEFTLRGKEAAGQAPLFHADSVQLGLTVLSWLGRDVRLDELTVEKPRIHIYVAEDGTTNLPEPRVKKVGGNPVQDLIALKIGKLNVHDGLLEYDSKSVPFSAVAEGMNATLTYDMVRPRYKVAISARTLRLPGGLAPQLEATALLEANRLDIERARLSQGDSWVEAAGPLNDFKKLSGDLKFKASVLLRDVPRSPVQEGFAVAEGFARFGPDHTPSAEGNVRVEQVGYAAKGIRVRSVSAASRFTLTPALLSLTGLAVRSPYGAWSGTGELRDWKRFQLRGDLTQVALDLVQAAVLDQPYAWNGTIRGPVEVAGEITGAGVAHMTATAALDIAPKEGELPVSGRIEAAWVQDKGKLDLGASHLETESARVNFQGTLGERLEVGLFASRLHDLDPVIGLLLREDGYRLPLSLQEGEARLDAAITGELKDPVMQGRLSMSNAVYESVVFQHAAADFSMSRNRLDLSRIELQRNAAETTGHLTLGLKGWAPSVDSPMDGGLELRNAKLADLLQLARLSPHAEGALAGTVTLSGTLGQPVGSMNFTITGATWQEEKVDRVTASLQLKPEGSLNGAVDMDQLHLSLVGQYRHPSGDFRAGELNLTMQSNGFQLHESEKVMALRPGLDGEARAELRTRITLEDGTPQLRSLDGAVAIRGLHIGGRQLGELQVNGTTSGGQLTVNATLNMPASKVVGNASIQLSGNYASKGTLQSQRVPFRLIKDLISESADPSKEAPWAVRGFMEGSVAWQGPLAEPRKGSAVVTVKTLQVRPRDTQALETQADTGDLTLRNEGPLVVEVDGNSARIKSAKVTALDTSLTLSGSYQFPAKNPWNLDIKGSANLAILGSFRPDLVSTGMADIDASVRGAAADPQLSGRMSIQKASFFLKDLPNGIENATGRVYFEKNRANIEQLTGQTGGGKFTINGFLGVSGEELTYRLQATAASVRVRYPEGVSTTLDASLTLTGSTFRSLLAGSITIQRSGFNTGSDLASMVGSSGNPIPSAASQHEFLRNLQFDVRIRTTPDAVFQSSYTQDLQTEADLRLRGSPAKPILLGSVKSSQGGVQFFGNRYTVSRGEILFYNTAVVQPNIDLDLETRVRGITVYINVSGPLSRLNFTYRSEPPLQSSEIVALLTVGRQPESTSSSVTASQSIRNQNVMENTPNSLLGGALSAGVSSRVERFFGSSRIRIDPNFTGVENLPQARLSVEQSISRDITLTYITNLSRSQQQIVRVEWDLNRQWSVVAVKDENGTFAMDFLYRKRFK
ncbi:translocation/assembly module TamB domain-containing protein [uncultured Paludibaculum sp.]|uniref:translocation/assembly module TamB domain-containing protein n=1 Tax=uncultured Paludibaculum sp. TaxID=1765020 RepID=UPI002AAA91AA|nr:translocation/assembly module TamB domain-containing protein [uncultured Paludibaculum sp.]